MERSSEYHRARARAHYARALRSLSFGGSRHLEAAVYHGKKAKMASGSTRLKFGAADQDAGEQIGEELMCPITQSLMRDPVVASSGYTFERTAIETWLRKERTCPLTRVPITESLLANMQVRSLTKRFVAVYRDSSNQAVRDLIQGLKAGVTPASAYFRMLGRYKYFELHKRSGDSTEIEKFANPVNKNREIHDESRDRDRYDAFLKGGRESVEVRNGVMHDPLPPFSVMLELYESFEVHAEVSGRAFRRAGFFVPDGLGGETVNEKEYRQGLANYDVYRENGYLRSFEPRANRVVRQRLS